MPRYRARPAARTQEHEEDGEEQADAALEQRHRLPLAAGERSRRSRRRRPVRSARCAGARRWSARGAPALRRRRGAWPARVRASRRVACSSSRRGRRGVAVASRRRRGRASSRRRRVAVVAGRRGARRHRLGRLDRGRGALASARAAVEVVHVAGGRRDHARAWRPRPGCARPSRARRSSSRRLEFWRSRVSAAVTARLMPALSLSSETCMKTMPMSATATSAIHARPRTRRSSSARVADAHARACRGAAPAAAARPRCRPRAARGSRCGRLDRRSGAAGAAARGASARRGGGAVAGGVAWLAAAAGSLRRPAALAAASSFRAARIRADFARGLAAISPGVARHGAAGEQLGLRRRGRSRTPAGPAGRCSPAPGRRGSASRAGLPANGRKSLQIGHSTRSSSHAAGSAASSWPSSSLTAMRMAWKTRLAGWPPAKRAGAGIASVTTSTSSLVVSSGAVRARADDARGRSGRA